MINAKDFSKTLVVLLSQVGIPASEKEQIVKTKCGALSLTLTEDQAYRCIRPNLDSILIKVSNF
jgi:hypothetical protein